MEGLKMSVSNISAGEPGAPRCSEEATGPEAHRLAKVAGVDSTLLPDLAFGAVLNRTRRIRLLTEAMAANLREQRGSEIDRDDVITALAMIEELADDALVDLVHLKPEGFDEVAL